jgi:2-polyprenyl-6-methoxyphenol hydroxylase-like FAD-dependent oxidoreductase
MKQYVVVGGGLVGLTAANALAGEGCKMTLLEQSEHLGGRATTQQDRGYLLNLGPHALHQGGVAAQTLRRWGIPIHGKPPDVSSASFLVRDGRMYPLVYTGGLLTTRLFSACEKWSGCPHPGTVVERRGSGWRIHSADSPAFLQTPNRSIDPWYPTVWSSAATAMNSGGTPSGGAFELAPAA